MTSTTWFCHTLRMPKSTCAEFKLLFLLIWLLPMVILAAGPASADKIYSWTQTMGGTSYDSGIATAVDSNGTIYLTGIFELTVDFNPDPDDTDNHTSAGNDDIFLTKFNLDGSYGWTLTMGGLGYDRPSAIVLDSDGNIYLTGAFEETADFDPSPLDSDLHTSGGSEDIFITKINSDGTYGWTQSMGSTSYDQGRAMAMDSDGNLYIAGAFRNTVDFNPDPLVADSYTAVGLSDMYVLKINADGSYGWTRTAGGTGYDNANAMSLDGSGNVFVAGDFENSVDFDFDPIGTDTHTSAGDADTYLTKLTSDGAYGWTKSIGGSDRQSIVSMANDSNGGTIVTGIYRGSADFDPDASATDDHTAVGSMDIFLTKINADGTYGWTQSIGGTEGEVAYSINLDSMDTIYLCGGFQGSVDFNAHAVETDIHTSAGLDDIFVTQIESDGSYAWTLSIGNTGHDSAYGAHVDSGGSIYVTGYFGNTVDFNADPEDTDSQTAIGIIDIFLMLLMEDTSACCGPGGGGGGSGCFASSLLK